MGTLAWPLGASADPGRVGLMADFGLPDGMVGAISYRAHGHVGLHLGGGHNSVSPGLRAGVQLLALDRGASPYAAFEAGHYFVGDASDLARDTATSMGLDDAELDSFGYSFGNAHLGMRLGSRTTAFYLQAGVSWLRVRATLRETRSLDTGGLPGSLTQPTVELFSDSAISLYSPSARLGLITYF